MIARTTRLREIAGLAPPKDITALDGLGVVTVEDLLRHYPRRYYDRGEIMDLSSLKLGEYATVQVKVTSVRHQPMRNQRGRQFTVFTVTDGTRRMTATFFNDRYFWRTFAAGDTVVMSGTVGRYKNTLQFTHPEVAVEDAEDVVDGVLGAIYPASSKINSWSIRRAVGRVLALDVTWDDAVPGEIRTRRGLLDEYAAIRLIHRPPDPAAVRKARERLAWDEAFLLQVVLAQRRALAAGEPATPRPEIRGGLLDAFDARLPFDLTSGQVEVAGEIADDLARRRPMHRLLQGEVGSGKTVVALRAMLTVIDSGGQAALLAPTEVLAQQHARSIATLLGPLGTAGELGGAEVATRVALLTGSQPAARRRRELLDAASGAAGIVIGTHALLEKQVQFADLGLVVVDEQHRFGVEQRDALRAKSATPPHLLVMTATPIPRTVAMTVFGDLETSTLRELPAGRSPISTVAVPLADRPDWEERVWGRVREEVAAGGRAYVVCPRIEGDETEAQDADWTEDDGVPPEDPFEDRSGANLEEAMFGERVTLRLPPAAVTEVARSLAEGPLVGLRIATLHGRQPAEVKDETMRAFAAGDIDVLVATTVIEVGVDVPEATMMVVLDADRFGISQLHQLRGRVGRGQAAGLCLLLTTAEEGTPARDRVEGVAATTDGFELARLDLEQRREGDVLGERQSGRRSSLRLLRLLRDEEIIVEARDEATAVVTADPGLSNHPALAAAVDDLVGQSQTEFLDKA